MVPGLRAALSMPAAHFVRLDSSDGLRPDEIPVLCMHATTKTTTVVTSFLFSSVEIVKRLLIKTLQLTACHPNNIKVSFKGIEVANKRTLASFNDRDGFILFVWELKDTVTEAGIRAVGLPPCPRMKQVLHEVSLGMLKGLVPRLAIEGTSGSYRMMGPRGDQVAIFKPQDEEPFSPNNPRALLGQLGQQGFRTGVLSGEGFVREHICYWIDQRYGGLFRVPATCSVECYHPSYCYNQDIDVCESNYYVP
ncbi:MAG: uncharacterized protein KVP18_003090 [Porospora cf. gigantea A]|uniref:uncharacterized protein n=1 Tax=Porospora cf. gigantea A TaxID=2853593 RepID=UPI00355949C3|nr:MAG: hypothetical protein KVP18_003090 [Porospora cf. gigantea A]